MTTLAGNRQGESRALARRGDRSWTWRRPATPLTDRLSLSLPARLAGTSPLLARVLDDAGYLRAMFGSVAVGVPLVGLALGVLAVHDVAGRAVPPTFAITIAIAVIGTFDAFAGFAAVIVFLAGVVVLGGLSSADAARTLLGLPALWFVAPIVAGSARPLRRPPTQTFEQHFDRAADIVIASLIGAWAVEEIIKGLPGLAGTTLPIAKQADLGGLIVLGALATRMLVETIAAHQYPMRLDAVQRAELPESSILQHLGATVLKLVILLFIAVAYLGSCWQLYVGGALFLVPECLRIYKQALPNSRTLFKVLPRGLTKTVFLLVVGGLWGAFVLSQFHSSQQIIRDSFVLVSVPGTIVATLGTLGRDGPRPEIHWRERVLGALVLTAGVLLVLGVVSV